MKIVKSITNKINNLKIYYNLQLENQIDKMILKTPEVIYDKKNELKFDNEVIDKFMETIKCKLTYVDFSILRRNLDKITIIYDTKKLDKRKKNVNGYYSASENELNVNFSNELEAFHELCHVSSCFVFNDYGYCGLQQNDLFGYIGKGLNEGYTQLLAERLLDVDNNEYYVIEKRMAYIIEKTIGKEKMYKYYFTANLKGLFDELCKYTSKVETLTFIETLDDINNYIYKSTYNLIRIIKNRGNLSYLNYYLTKLFYNYHEINNICPSDDDCLEVFYLFSPFMVGKVNYNYNISKNVKKLEKEQKNKSK